MMLRRDIRIAGLMFLAGTIALSLALPACKNTPAPASASTPAVSHNPDTIRPAGDLYGLPREIYLVEEARVRRNQTLSDLDAAWGGR